MKHSPKWLLEKILSCGNQHGKALMYIIEFQNALASDGDLASVSDQRGLLNAFAFYMVKNYNSNDGKTHVDYVEEWLSI